MVYIPQGMKLLLFLFSLLHRSGCRIKNWLYTKKRFHPRRASLPVISVGNIAFGGSGKTPLVIHLMTFLIKEGFKPAMITRGYKGRWERSGGVLSDGKSLLGSWQESGDEAFMVALNIPQAGVFIGKNRMLSCQKAKDLGFELVVLDDGFQHRRLSRDVDIVLYDPRDKFSLRESVSSLERADVLLIEEGVNRQQKEKMKKVSPHTAIFEYSVESKGFFRLERNEEESAEVFQGKRIMAFCGIARPERFLTLLQKEAIHPVGFLVFPDHYSYPIRSLDKISKRGQKLQAEVLITTEKDAVKIRNTQALQQIPLYYLKIDLKLEEEFHSMMSSLLQNRV
jgi:tetraacyldisaccharide 4'-kinase